MKEMLLLLTFWSINSTARMFNLTRSWCNLLKYGGIFDFLNIFIEIRGYIFLAKCLPHTLLVPLYKAVVPHSIEVEQLLYNFHI